MQLNLLRFLDRSSKDYRSFLAFLCTVLGPISPTSVRLSNG